ncbi:MAG: class I tRNA ligase family protein, partial [Gemmatimonadota bacterium]
NFANKLWNAGRFILSNLDGPTRPLAGPQVNVVRADELTLADRWIIARCDAAVRDVTDAYERFRLNDAAATVYRFIWSDLADWYIEQIKPRLYGDIPGGDVARAVAASVFDVALRLLHPVTPFITEALWGRLPGRPPETTIVRARWPQPDSRACDDAALREFGLVQELVGGIRAIRAEYGIQPGQQIRAIVSGTSTAARNAFDAEHGTITRLAKLASLSFEASDETVGGHAVLNDGSSLFVPLGDAIDVGRECKRLGDEVARLRQLTASQRAKLANAQFTARAPADVVQRERQKLESWTEQADLLTQKRELLGC